MADIHICTARPCTLDPVTEIIPGDEKWVMTPSGAREPRHAECVYMPGEWSTVVEFAGLDVTGLAGLKRDVSLKIGESFHQLGQILVERDDTGAVTKVSAFSNGLGVWLFLVVDGKINPNDSPTQHP